MPTRHREELARAAMTEPEADGQRDEAIAIASATMLIAIWVLSRSQIWLEAADLNSGGTAEPARSLKMKSIAPPKSPRNDSRDGRERRSYRPRPFAMARCSAG